MKKQTWRLIFLLSTFHWDTEITQCKCLNEILDCKRMMFGKLWKELWSFYAGHWWLFRITKTWSENRQQVENFQFLVSKLSIARQNAVSQRNNFLTDRNFIWFCGKNLGDTISLVKCSTVHCTLISYGHHAHYIMHYWSPITAPIQLRVFSKK